jgi:hypothetical protein
MTRRAVSPASPAQREKCSGKPCVACGSPFQTVPAHLIDRAQGGDDDPRITVPLCPGCHNAYDGRAGMQRLDLLPFLEPGHREELAYAVQLVGLVRALQRITNSHWRVVDASRFAA